MRPSLSIIIPTRERASYLPYAIKTCLANHVADLEILLLDNASTDNTSEVVTALGDSRIRYERSDVRLSMRDNFEKGLELARGDIICFIGDDDGLLPKAIETALKIFSNHDVDALSAARAHYYWPDLRSARKSTGLLPRREGVQIEDAEAALRSVLNDSNYYRLPCLYHGFVRTHLVRKIAQRQGRFFISSQVDMFSSIALSSERIRYAYSDYPLVINGGSARSNGASHFGGGTGKEKSMWKQEDDLGFLPGFDGSMTIGSLIVESGLRYCRQRNDIDIDIFSMLDRNRVETALSNEAAQRLAAGRPIEDIAHMYESAGLTQPEIRHESHSIGRTATRARVERMLRQARSFAANRPIDMARHGVSDVFAASRYFERLLSAKRTGILHDPIEQISSAVRLARG